jgi:flagellar motor switch protein FliM
LLFRVLDILLAMPEGAGAEMGADESLRRVTGIELFILREFFEVFTRSLRDAWAPVYPVAFSQIATEEELKSRAATYGDDLALVLRATVELSGLEADVRLVIPAFLARMVQMKSASAVTSSSGAEPVHTNILNSLGAAILQMEAVLGGASIRFRNLLDLAPGQILVPGNKGTASIDCLVNEKPRFTGMLVASNGMCAIQIDTLTGTKLSDAAGNPFTGEAATPDK